MIETPESIYVFNLQDIVKIIFQGYMKNNNKWIK